MTIQLFPFRMDKNARAVSQALAIGFWLLTLPLLHCGRPNPLPVTPAYYYWQTSFSLAPAQRDYLAGIHCAKLYVKVADIGLEPGNREIVPYSQLKTSDTLGISTFQVVPVVFITNEVFGNITPEKNDWLAQKLAAICNRSRFGKPSSGPPEIQIDCDWTERTQAAFFQFLTVFRSKLPTKTRLSATIRLHQYKFPDKTGVPPVDRGMLMCYNTGDIDDADATNSIFDPADALKYLKGAKKAYPLPLDLALPAFSWLLVYRNDELWKIIPGAPEETPTGILREGTFLAGHYLRPGDLIRRESVPADLLIKATQLAAQANLADDATVAFFHLDEASPHDYPVQLIDAVCHIADSIRVKK